MNISPNFIAVVNNCWDSWNQAQEHIENNRKNIRNQEALKESFDSLSEETKITDEESLSSKLSELTSGLYSSHGESNLVDIATPYKVTNLTGLTIFVETLFDDKRENYIIKDGKTNKIAVSYDKQTKRGSNGIISKLSDDIKIQFEGLYLPIKKISLNKLGKNIHKLTENDEENDFIYYETKVVDMNKVLTIRTKNLLINSTHFSYNVIIKNPDKKYLDKTLILKPGDSISFPKEYIDCKVSLKTLEDKDYSNYIPAKKLIFKTEVDHTNYIRSGTTFTMVRKEQNKTLKDCYDIHLIPPIRIRNGLPVSMHVTLIGQNIEFIQEKGEEKHISFYSPDELIQISVHIDGYEEDPIVVKFLK